VTVITSEVDPETEAIGEVERVSMAVVVVDSGRPDPGWLEAALLPELPETAVVVAPLVVDAILLGGEVPLPAFDEPEVAIGGLRLVDSVDAPLDGEVAALEVPDAVDGLLEAAEAPKDGWEPVELPCAVLTVVDVAGAVLVWDTVVELAADVVELWAVD
jgi:hypothetical protein